VSRQDIRSGSLDLMTPEEMSVQLHKHLGDAFSKHLRELYRGLKVMRIPMVVMQATATAFPLFSGPPNAQSGPESGYIWDVRRVTVESSLGSADTTTKIALYTGSDPTANAQHLIDRVGCILGQAYFPGSKSIWLWPDEVLYAQLTGATVGATYTLTGIAMEAPVEMQGKLMQ
jgi:hypothetical protein